MFLSSYAKGSFPKQEQNPDTTKEKTYRFYILKMEVSVYQQKSL